MLVQEVSNAHVKLSGDWKAAINLHWFTAYHWPIPQHDAQYKRSLMISIRAAISKAQQVSVFQSMAMPAKNPKVSGSGRQQQRSGRTWMRLTAVSAVLQLPTKVRVISGIAIYIIVECRKGSEGVKDYKVKKRRDAQQKFNLALQSLWKEYLLAKAKNVAKCSSKKHNRETSDGQEVTACKLQPLENV